MPTKGGRKVFARTRAKGRVKLSISYENNLGMNRVGFPLPRGSGNAVQRNLSKRSSREVYRLLKTHLNTGYDILLLIYPGNDSFSTRRVQFRTLFQKAGIYVE